MRENIEERYNQHHQARGAPDILIGEGILVGGIGGLVVLPCRMCLEYAGKWLNMILEWPGKAR